MQWAFWKRLRIEAAPADKDVAVLRLSGPFLLRDDSRFEKAVAARAERRIVVELSGVPRMDSAALGALAEAHAVLHRSGRRLAVVGANRAVSELMRITGLDRVFERYDTLQAALRDPAASA